MSYGIDVELSCPGGCGTVYTRVDYSVDPPPIPIVPEPGWYYDMEDGWQHTCELCGIEDLEDEYQAVVAMWNRGPVGGALYDFRRALLVLEDRLVDHIHALNEVRDRLDRFAAEGMAA